MSLLGNLFPSLPSLSGAGPTSEQANFTLAPTSSVLNESFAKITGVFGGINNGVVGGFKSLTAGGPSFKTLETPSVTSPSATASSINQAATDSQPDNTYHKVKLTAAANDGESFVIQNDVYFPHEPLMERVVEFDSMPEVAEVRTVDYEPLSTPQMPGEFQKYRGTKSTQWTITATLTCRTKEEAYRNYVYMNTLRGWTAPYFGEKQRFQFADSGSVSGKLGAPPPVIRFSGWRGIVGELPVVITNLSWNWPRDCDWIPTGIADDKYGQDIPFPTVMNITINLVESFSALQFNNFDLVAFRRGRMIDAYSIEPTQDGAVSVAEPIGGNQGITNGAPQPVDLSRSGEAVNNTWTSARDTITRNSARSLGFQNNRTTPTESSASVEPNDLD